MQFHTSYDQDFVDLMWYLKGKYGQKMFDLDGIGRQLDLCQFSKEFFSASTTADASVDANSNVCDVSNITYNTELPKPYFKINSYFILWKQMRQLYGIDVANTAVEQQINGSLYINDAHGISSGMAYCFNYSTYDIMLLGLPMVSKIKSVPPKHLYSFKSQLEQFVVLAANSTLGATGLADLFIVMSYYVANILRNKADAGFKFASEGDCWNYVGENLTSFIYTINQPLRASQSPFTNVSIYDDEFLNSLCPNYIFPDGSTPDIGIVKQIQNLYVDIMNTEMKRTPITFPVTTACFAVNEDKDIIDEDFARLIAEKNQQFGFINIYCGKSSTLSSCCFLGEQKTLTRSSNGVQLMSFKELHESPWDSTKRNFTVFYNGGWAKAKVIKVPIADKKIYKVKTVNNKELLVTEDHINVTSRGDVSTNKLTCEDYLLFNTRVASAVPESDMKLTFAQGVLIGAYLGDGSCDAKRNSVHLSLNENKYVELLPYLEQAVKDWGLSVDFKLAKPYNKVYPVSAYDEDLLDVIKYWVSGNYCYEKDLNLKCVDQDKSFRKGILFGFYATDGGNSNRLYTTSTALVSSIEVLLTSLGKVSIIDISDRTDEPVVIRDETFNRNYPLYCVRWYTPNNRPKQKDIFKISHSGTYFRIKEISEVSTEDGFVYCFDMKDEESPYFTLPNGVTTHNCRLRSETDNEYFNSFGSGSTKIGSLGVVTINLPRAAIINKESEEDFFNYLRQAVGTVARINHTKRAVVKKRIDQGILPLYSLGFMDLNKQYSTVGINGLNECCEIMGYDILSDAGQSFVLRLLEVINAENDRYQKQYKTPHNCEQIPGENVSIKLADKDRLLGYNSQYDFYSNQFIPLITKADMLDRIKLQGLFDAHFSGGAICHVNVEQRVDNPDVIVNLIKACAKAGVIYWAINHNLQMCEDGHMSVGKGDSCSICGSKITDNFTRVVGFLVNTKSMAPKRRELDYPQRQFYKEV